MRNQLQQSLRKLLMHWPKVKHQRNGTILSEFIMAWKSTLLHHLHEVFSICCKKGYVPQHMRRPSLYLTRRATTVTATTIRGSSILRITQVILPSLQTLVDLSMTAWLQGSNVHSWPDFLCQTTPGEMPGTEETSVSGLCSPQQGLQPQH